MEALRVQVRYEQRRKALPTAAVLDTQSVKTTEKEDSFLTFPCVSNLRKPQIPGIFEREEVTSTAAKR